MHYIESNYTSAKACLYPWVYIDLALEDETKAQLKTKLEFLFHKPNPFSEETKIAFDLCLDQYAYVRVIFSKGEEIKSFRQEYKLVYNDLLVRKNDLNHQGIYFCLVTNNL